ncbi:MAG: sulfur carrier protein ThiS [Planctomycetota bacterium]
MPAGTTVAEVVARRGLPPQVVAVEVNQELVPRAEREAWSLVEGDRVEL